MHVGIFETDHFEAAYPVIRLFDNGENDITIFVYEKSYRQLQFLPAGKISFDHFSPVGPGFFRYPGISVTRKIDKIHSLIDEKKIDRLRASGR